jgi:diguanylate cyclase (GGDEF)-like protein/PAS domain S-box-containing protein
MHDGDAVLYVNPAAVRTLGAQSDAEIVGRPLADFIDPSSLFGVRNRIAGLREDGDISEPAKVTLLRVDGTTLVVHSVAAVRMRDGMPTYEVIFRDDQSLRAEAIDDDPALAASATEAIITTDLDGIVTGWDADAQSLYGRFAHQVMGMPVALAPSALARAGGRQPATHRGAAGIALALRVLAIRTADGYVIICDTLVGDTRNRHRVHGLLDLLHDGVVIMSSDGRFEFTNAAARRILGSDADDLIGVHYREGGDLPMYNVQGQRIGTDSHPIRYIQSTGLGLGGDVVGVDRLDGRRVWITGRGCLVDPCDPQNSSVMFSFTDITEHHDARQRLLYDATHDWLTGLPNRVHALNQAALALAETGPGRLSAVLFIDLDRLKTVNDRHGHPIGDDVLRIAAQRLRSATREQDLVARIGGDEFVVLLMGPVADSELEVIARRLHDVLDEDINVESVTLHIGASVGITTVAGDDDRSLAEVLRDADAAMYRAKAQGPASTAYFEQDQPESEG